MSFQIPCMRTKLDKTLDQLLSDYFPKGFTYLEIQKFLRFYHQQTIGLSTIKRLLKKLNLFRRPIERIISGCCKGRIKWQRIQCWIQESLGSLTKNGLKSPTRRCSREDERLFYNTMRMECQEESEENRDGESTSVLD